MTRGGERSGRTAASVLGVLAFGGLVAGAAAMTPIGAHGGAGAGPEHPVAIE